MLHTGNTMKATSQKTPSPLKSPSLLSPLVAFTSIALLCGSATAAPPFFRSSPRSNPRSRIEVSVSSGPFYRQDYRYRNPGPYYGGPSFYCPPAYYPPTYCPPAYYPPAPVYIAPPVYSAAPVYQGLPPASSSNYRVLAPSGSHLVAQVQEKLRGYGYYRGGVDGLAGAGTRSAIRAYQVDRGIQVTGRVDEELLSDLGL